MKHAIVLASASPRRAELLSRICANFEIMPAEVDETPLAREEAVALALRLARLKAAWVASRRPEALVIGSDTVVALGERLLAKPETSEEACTMLSALSGREHRVITAVALVWPGGEEAFADIARVTFRPLGADEIAAYVATGEPMDKAGGYAIQGGASSFVAKLEGCLDTVVGLPVEAISQRLRALQLLETLL